MGDKQTAERVIDRVAILGQLNPGDTLIISTDHPVNEQDAERTIKYMRRQFPDNKVLLITQGVELKVLEGG